MKAPPQTEDPKRRDSPGDWKRWLTLIFLSMATGFILHQVRTAIARRPPAWLQVKKIVGPALGNESFSSPLRQFRGLVDEAQQEANRCHRPLGRVCLCEVRKGSPEAITWTLDQFDNQGFDAQSHFQRELPGPSQHLIGYYTLDGKPLSAVIRQLTYLGSEHPTVEFGVAPPVLPGAKLFVIRIERGLKIVPSAHEGAYFLSLGRLPPTNEVLAAQGVHFPRGAVIVQHSPGGESGTSSAGLPTVIWFNSSLKPQDAAPSVLFRWSS
jgi:hypothetical protein